jgi:RNA polymerase sigma factor (sigma-70 family)
MMEQEMVPLGLSVELANRFAMLNQKIAFSMAHKMMRTKLRNMDPDEIKAEALYALLAGVRSQRIDFARHRREVVSYLFNAVRNHLQKLIHKDGVASPLRKDGYAVLCKQIDEDELSRIESREETHSDFLLIKRVRDAVDELPSDHSRVVKEYFGLNGYKKTYKEIAEVGGYSIERARQKCNAAIKKLSVSLEFAIGEV